MTPKEEQEFHAQRMRESTTDLRVEHLQTRHSANRMSLTEFTPAQRVELREAERVRQAKIEEQKFVDHCRQTMLHGNRLPPPAEAKLERILNRRRPPLELEPIDAPRLTPQQALGTLGSAELPSCLYLQFVGRVEREPMPRPTVVSRPWDSQPIPEQGPPPPVRSTVFSSDGTSLQFHTQQEEDDYEAALHDVRMQTYHVMRVKYGVWASNQDKYVSSPDQLTDADGRTMETLYAAWCRKKGM